VVLLTSSSRLKLFARAFGTFLILAALYQCAAQCQEAKLIDSPAPKLEILEDLHSFPPFAIAANFAPEKNLIVAPAPRLQPLPYVRHSRFALDRTAIILGAVQGASELYDGLTTKYFLHHCSTCIEVDPLSRFLMGSKPTWGGMIAAGSLEGVATTYFHQSMRRSSHKWIRRGAPLAPLALTGLHIIEGSRNLPLKNLLYCADPGYILVGSVCAVPPSAQPVSSSGPTTGASGDPRKMTFPHSQ
jgi:hypothetical protein